jgi:hypothetical protein
MNWEVTARLRVPEITPLDYRLNPVGGEPSVTVQALRAILPVAPRVEE